MSYISNMLNKNSDKKRERRVVPQWHLVKAKNEVKPSTTGVSYQIVINNCQDHRKKGTPEEK